MISVTQVSNAALSSDSVDVRPSSTDVARPRGQTSANQAEDTNMQHPTAQQVQRAVVQANAQVAGFNESISFRFVKELGQLVVQVTDKNSGEVVRQIPSKEFIAQQIASKAFLGLLLDKQA